MSVCIVRQPMDKNEAYKIYNEVKLMIKHSKALDDTVLWQTYREKIALDSARSLWVKNVYESATDYLKDVRGKFKNYTLHDETHILNVLDAMGGLLGDRVGNLSVGEMELLILAACLHDIGMVYTDEEERLCYEDNTACNEFLKEHCVELFGHPAEEWTEDTRQWYLRACHPFRLWEVLQNEAWRELVASRPNDLVSLRCIIAVCQAHGETPEELHANRHLDYLPASDVDPLFCALLLRLADLLDFDDTRAPKVLYNYVAANEKSREEWDKHRASAGFRYPASPTTADLPYKARCSNPGIEHAVRDFLDWIDDELRNCARLQKRCNGWHQEFPFPRVISRNEIEADGYMSGDFCLTMDQEQILNLLTGENLYDNRNVFVRELLQNAIDATLLRSVLDQTFVPEESRIDFWEWNDKEGNLWFRIDDQGTGMTLGMLQRYFLKVGNSYYTSQELERDLCESGQPKTYEGISRFGIGFLSCFLCGDYVEVSTLYWNPDKNRREDLSARDLRSEYGIRLEVTGLTGYYTLKNQAENHWVDSSLPFPDGFDAGASGIPERRGYRTKPGTSIVIRLNPGDLGTLDLKSAVKDYLRGARMPVYYNNERLGRTYKEIMQAAHEFSGERFYELTPDLKIKFDECFPKIRENYPKLKVTVIPLDTAENQILSGLSGVLIKYDLCFDQPPRWEAGGLKYEIHVTFKISPTTIRTMLVTTADNADRHCHWSNFEKLYGSVNVAALQTKLERLSACPQTEEELGEEWLPFRGKLSLDEAWQFYLYSQSNKEMPCDIIEFEYPIVSILLEEIRLDKNVYVYQGVVAYNCESNDRQSCLFFLEKEYRPIVNISRTKIVNLPLNIAVACASIFVKHELLNSFGIFSDMFCPWMNALLYEWREVRQSPVGEWIENNLKEYWGKVKQSLQKGINDKAYDTWIYLHISSSSDTLQIMAKYWFAEFQDNYSMTINYEKGQMISFHEKGDRDDNIYDMFPPMMFCKAASDYSRKYICCADYPVRRGITRDHLFVIWLFKNAPQLKKYFQRQFLQIIDCLCNEDAARIIEIFDIIRAQLLALTDRHGVDIVSMPQLTMNDFWLEADEE